MTTRTCSTIGCGRPLGAANKSGVCSSCSSGYQPKGDKRSDADDAVLERVERSSVKPPPPAKKTKAQRHSEVDATPAAWLEKFYRLQEALSLDPDATLEEWCRVWVEETTRRALERNLLAAAPKPNGALAAIGADYEKAREQAEAPPRE